MNQAMVVIGWRRWVSGTWLLPAIGTAVLGGIVLFCVLSLPVTLEHYNEQNLEQVLQPPTATPGIAGLLGTDRLGRSLLYRCALGGAISLGIGLAAAMVTMVIGTGMGMIAGYLGGRVDAMLMRGVDVMYGLPYILLVILLKVALQPMVETLTGPKAGDVVTLLLAIGLVSWLTLARVVRGQVLSLKGQPFVEAARATGCSTRRILLVHLLPNLLGPIIVYTTLTVPTAILEESFLSFLGIGVQLPLPSWGNLASEGLPELNPVRAHLWMPGWPCAFLALTLLALNFVGDGLRDWYDPRSRRRRG
jgi:ABC-type dipeptide/oligopeptide/nickel transport system permease subunit